MPLDPSIYSKQIQIGDVMRRNRSDRDQTEAKQADMVLRQIQLDNAKMENQDRRRAADAYDPTMAAEMSQYQYNKARRDDQLGDLDIAIKRSELLTSTMARVTDPVTYGLARSQIISAFGPEAAQQLPEAYPGPEAIDRIKMMSLSAKEQLQMKRQQEQDSLGAAKFKETKRHNKAVENRPETEVNLIDKGNSKYVEERLKSEAGSFEELQKSATSAYNQNLELDRFIEASGDSDSGGAQPIITGVKNFLSSFGIPAESLTNVAVMQQAVGTILGNKMAELGARGLTDKDMEILRESLPRVNISKEARVNVANILKKRNQSIINDYDYAAQDEDKRYPDMKTTRPRWYQSMRANGLTDAEIEETRRLEKELGLNAGSQ